MNPDELADRYRESGDPPSLHGLSEVDWAGVADAYGPATDIPCFLRALVSDDADHRDFAAEMLFQTIWHQGTVYSASATAVPFLYRLLESAGPHDKQMVATLIAEIGAGEPSFFRCESDTAEFAHWERILAPLRRSLPDEIAAGRVVAAEVRRQVALRFGLLRRHLWFAAEPGFIAPEAAKASANELLERLATRLQSS